MTKAIWFQEQKCGLILKKLLNVIHHIERLKNKSNVIISIDEEKSFDKCITHSWVKKKTISQTSNRREHQ